MLNPLEVDAEEERLRALARDLPDAQRKAFFQEATEQLRDPDTYAVLNWFFLAGLHHLYLGKWIKGLCNLAVFVAGIVLMFVRSVWLGLGLILLVTVWELWALFRAQIIVQDWNNRLYRDLLKDYGMFGEA
ncbi:MAG TPA: TM2 domain-containing protein [Gammaproteobacteria bacterium]|nr:TM2 domain-containing protein [Gammaproteobacteria bacterium]